ncbi:MAG: universal stress protein [Pseudomonadales bacterium]|nr:universal stress protein [Pseudomonadales bacterium]
MIGHLLLAVTEHESASSMMALAREFAAANGARLSVLLVAEPIPDLDRIAEATGTDASVLAARAEAAQLAAFETTIDTMTAAAPPEITVRTGTAFVEIIRHVVEHDVDMLIKAPDARGAQLGHVLTSTDQHLLRKCPGVVWLSDAAPRGMPRTIVLCVDVDDGTATEPDTVAALNDRLVVCARALAAAQDAELHLVHVWDAPGAALVRRWAAPADADASARDYTAQVEARRREAFARIEARLRGDGADSAQSGLRVRAHFLQGSPRQRLPELTRSLGAEVLIMGTTARTGVPGLVIGNTAEDVLNSVDCGLLSVKPPSFVSPITAD